MPRTPSTSTRSKRRPTKQADRRPIVGADLEHCVYCGSSDVTRAGKRYKKHEILQRWFCHDCAASFTKRRAGKGSTYPLKVILESLCHFYQGHTLERTAQYINRRFGLALHSRTLSRWLNEYRELTTYDRLRGEGRHRFTPHQLIRSTRLHHKQVYIRPSKSASGLFPLFGPPHRSPKHSNYGHSGTT